MKIIRTALLALSLALPATALAGSIEITDGGQVVSTSVYRSTIESDLEQAQNVAMNAGVSCNAENLLPDGSITRETNNKLAMFAPNICSWYATFYGMLGTGTVYERVKDGGQIETIQTQGMNIIGFLNNLSVVLLLVFLAAGGVRYGLIGRDMGKLFGIVLKAFIAGFIIANTSTIQKVGYQTFMVAYKASEQASAPATRASMDAAARTFSSNVGLLANFTAAGKGIKLAIAAANGGRALFGAWLNRDGVANEAKEDAGGDAEYDLKEQMGSLIVMPFLWGYAVALYFFVITMVCCLVGLPMAAAAMVAMNRSEVLVGVAGTYFGLIIGVMVLPVAFNVGVNIAYVQPMNQLNDKMSKQIKDLDENQAELDQFAIDYKAYEQKMRYNEGSQNARTASSDTIMESFLKSPEGSRYAKSTGFIGNAWDSLKSSLYGIILTIFGVAVGVGVAAAVPAIAIKQFTGGFNEGASAVAKGAGGMAAAGGAGMMAMAGKLGQRGGNAMATSAAGQRLNAAGNRVGAAANSSMAKVGTGAGNMMRTAGTMGRNAARLGNAASVKGEGRESAMAYAKEKNAAAMDATRTGNQARTNTTNIRAQARSEVTREAGMNAVDKRAEQIRAAMNAPAAPRESAPAAPAAPAAPSAPAAPTASGAAAGGAKAAGPRGKAAAGGKRGGKRKP